MRHEIIRMEHVNISRPGRHEIEDLNLIICRGYSMGVAGVENSKEILADFFEGKGTLARGRIYLDGQPWKPEGKRDFEDAGIFVISKDTCTWIRSMSARIFFCYEETACVKSG